MYPNMCTILKTLKAWEWGQGGRFTRKAVLLNKAKYRGAEQLRAMSGWCERVCVRYPAGSAHEEN